MLLLGVAALYFAREIFIPIALAILLSFLLGPLAIRLRHWRLGRAASALIVVVFAFTVVGAIGAWMTSQIGDVVRQLPEYQQNIHKKLQSAGAIGGRGILGRLGASIQELRRDVTPPPETQNRTDNPGTETQKPVPVEVRNSAFEPTRILRAVAGSLANILVTAFIVTVLTFFMLVERDDLRDRLIRIIGTSKLNLTTKLLDDTSRRVSRYLLMQLVVNVTYGFLICIGLRLIGIPNPVLWGMFATVLRYIPYAGPWIAASMPFLLALAVDPGWTRPLLVAGLFVAVEVTVANFVEPWLYGSSTGITPLAVLLAAVFWTWLWGPVGLLLSMPLTVCLVSVGRHLPAFGFLNILFGDEPVLSPAARFYQRLLAADSREATDMAEAFLKDKQLEELYDETILPVLLLAEKDCRRGLLGDEKHGLILQHIHFLVDDLPEYVRKQRPKQGEPEADSPENNAQPASRPIVYCAVGETEADEIAGIMLVQTLEGRGIAAKLSFASEYAAGRENLPESTQAVCVSAISTPYLLSVRRTCKQVGGRFPESRIVAAWWGGSEEINDFVKHISSVPPENLVTSLRQAADRISSIVSGAQGQPTPTPKENELAAG